MTQQHTALARELLAVCKEQREAIDRLFAMLIVETQDKQQPQRFYPSQSGQPWQACVHANEVMKRATEELG